MSSAFFQGQYSDLFRPLTSKYREDYVAAIKTLHNRIHGPEADYESLATRERLKEVLMPVIGQQGPLTAADSGEDGPAPRFRSSEDKVAELLRELEDSGWLESHLDKANHAKTYRLSRVGKAFAQTFVRLDRRLFQTRQRHVRNTKNALAAFTRDLDVYNLIDAVHYAGQVASDLDDDVVELDEQKARLTEHAMTQATEAFDLFMAYMHEHFVPDLAVKLSADSVERHAQAIHELVDGIRDWEHARRLRARQELERLAPTLAAEAPGDPLEWLLDRIDHAIHLAQAHKMPELRRALTGFSRRSKLIINQATALIGLSHQDDRLNRLFELLRDGTDETREQVAGALASACGPVAVRLLDPARFRPTERRVPRQIDLAVDRREPTEEERLEMAVREALERAFRVRDRDVRDWVVAAAAGYDSIRLSELSVLGAEDFLNFVNALEAASIAQIHLGDGLSLQPERVLDDDGYPVRFSNTYGTFEDYRLRVVREAAA